MSNVNFSSSTPAAPPGTVNVTWQFDAGGDISANVPASVAAAWAPWTPTVTIAPGGFTLNGIAVAEFVQVGSQCFFHLAVNVTITGLGNPADVVSCTLPVARPASPFAMQVAGAAWGPSTTPADALWINTSVGATAIAFGVGSLLTSGTAYTLSASGSYRTI